MSGGCVANWGNDNNAGTVAGSEPTLDEWKNAKRSLQGAIDAGFGAWDKEIHANGYYNGITTSIGNLKLYDNIFSYNTSGDQTALSISTSVYNLKCEGFPIGISTSSSNAIISSGYIKNSVDAIHGSFLQTYRNSGNISKTIFNNCINILINNKNLNQNTIHKCVNFSFEATGDEVILYKILSNINEININRIGVTYFQYSLFINSAFKFTGGGISNDETTFEYPAGADDIEKLENLRDRMAIVYGGVAADYLEGCKYYSGSYNDIFQDADNGDFNLKPDSIAVNMAYDGSYIGARPVGQNIPIANFTKTNIDTNGRVIDQNVDANAKSTSIIDLGKIRQIVSWTALGDRAARNGQQINTEENLSAPIAPGSNVLEDAKVYMCINDTITLDDAGATTYNPWETFVAVDEGSGVGLGFSTAGSGQLQEVLIEDYDQKIKVKSSKTDALLSTAPVLNFLLYSNPPRVNVDANGIPTAGDGDTVFDEGTAVDFYTRYLDPDIDIQENNLPAR